MELVKTRGGQSGGEGGSFTLEFRAGAFAMLDSGQWTVDSIVYGRGWGDPFTSSDLPPAHGDVCVCICPSMLCSSASSHAWLLPRQAGRARISLATRDELEGFRF